MARGFLNHNRTDMLQKETSWFWDLSIIGCLVAALAFSHSYQQHRVLSHVWIFVEPMVCSPPGSSVHGILQARMLEWVAISCSRGSSPPRGFSTTAPPGKHSPSPENWKCFQTVIILLLVVKLLKNGGSSCFLSSQKASRYFFSFLQYILSFSGNLSDVYIIISPGRKK